MVSPKFMYFVIRINFPPKLTKVSLQNQDLKCEKGGLKHICLSLKLHQKKPKQISNSKDCV